MNILYLASENTLPHSKNRREDAFEFDQTLDALHGPFDEQGLALHPVAWDDPSIEWNKYNAAIIGTTWDYVEKKYLFLKTLKEIESHIPLFNSSEIIEWNINKTYLKELQTKGAPLIPTCWIDDPKNIEDSKKAFEILKSDQLVFKQQTGAGGEGQFKVNANDPLPEFTHPMMAQPFLESIINEGEFSFIFIDGRFSHCLIKKAASGEYRIQSVYGGIEEKVNVTQNDLNSAQEVLNLIDGDAPLYARIDMVRGEKGNLLLMELEIIEPFLYPLQGPELGTLMAKALRTRLT